MNRIVVSLFFILFGFSAYAQQGIVAGPFSPCSGFGTTSGTCLQGAGALGSPSSVGTLPAYTLGGTISGGGNQINNVVIGAVTPLAGTHTTIQANTSINVGATITPDSILTVNANTVATAVSSSPYNVHIIGANSANPGIISDAFAGQNLYTGRIALGTAASPTQVTGSSILLGFTGQALDDTATYRSSATLELATLGAVTSASAGGFVRIRTITTGTVSLTEKLRVGSGLSIGDTTDPGIGGLRATGATVQFSGLATDAATTDNTVCIGATGTLLKGSGTLGICLGTSGRQFKTAFTPMTAGIDEIAKLDLWNYRYRDGFGDSGERMQYGPTAQDVEKVLPDLVRHDSSGEAINYDIGAFVPITLHALQQLKADNDNLRACQQNWKCRIFGIGG